MATLAAGALGLAAVLLSPSAVLTRSMASRIGGVCCTIVVAATIATVIALPIAGIATVFKRRFGPVFLQTYSHVVVIVGFFVLVASLGLEERASTESMESTRQVVTAVESDIRRLLNGEGSPKPSAPRSDVNPNPTNDGEGAVELVRAFSEDLMTLQKDYFAALDEAGLPRLLDPDRLVDDASFEETRRIHGEVKRVVSEFKMRADSLLTDFPKRLESLDGVTKHIAAEGFGWALGKAAPDFQENWQIEVTIVERMGELVELLESTRGHWTSEGGQFNFDRREDLQRFNAVAAQIDAGRQRQAEMREKSRKSANRILDVVRGLLK